jgi:putative glycosyltransferase
MYYSAPYLNEFYTRIRAAAEKITSDYEIIFVNDGSPDDSLKMAVSLYENDPKVRVIDLSRNFGHHKAAMTGLAHAKGDSVFLIDVDLEEEPELLNRFYDIFKDSDADVVYGVQTKRMGGLWEKATGALYWWMFNLLV